MQLLMYTMKTTFLRKPNHSSSTSSYPGNNLQSQLILRLCTLQYPELHICVHPGYS